MPSLIRSLGELDITTLDADGGGNGRVNASKDRIQQTIEDAVATGVMGVAVRRTRSYVWDLDWNGAARLAQTTTTLYNDMLQPYQVTHPDSTITSSEYYVTGLLKKTWGSRTYPVEYTYDAQGRMKTMTTWQNFSAGTGAAITTWNHEPYRGLLTSKLYHGETVGTEYTYTAGARLKTRRRARAGTGGARILTLHTYGFESDGFPITLQSRSGVNARERDGNLNTHDGRGSSVLMKSGTLVGRRQRRELGRGRFRRTDNSRSVK